MAASGADQFVDAPELTGLTLGPVTTPPTFLDDLTKELEPGEPLPQDYDPWDEMSWTAWWKIVAPADGWLLLDGTETTTGGPGAAGSNSFICLWRGTSLDNLVQLYQQTGHPGYGDPEYDGHPEFRSPLAVQEGATYYVQMATFGMTDNVYGMDDAPTPAGLAYVLTAKFAPFNTRKHTEVITCTKPTSYDTDQYLGYFQTPWYSGIGLAGPYTGAVGPDPLAVAGDGQYLWVNETSWSPYFKEQAGIAPGTEDDGDYRLEVFAMQDAPYMLPPGYDYHWVSDIRIVTVCRGSTPEARQLAINPADQYGPGSWTDPFFADPTDAAGENGLLRFTPDYQRWTMSCAPNGTQIQNLKLRVEQGDLAVKFAEWPFEPGLADYEVDYLGFEIEWLEYGVLDDTVVPMAITGELVSSGRRFKS